MYHDAYAHTYQKVNGFEIVALTKDGEKVGYLSLKPSTRSTYDIAMRDATIDGLITFDEIDKIYPGQIFYKRNRPTEKFIFQSINEFEFQINTRNINAIKQNCFVDVLRNQYVEEIDDFKYMPVHENLVSFVSMVNRDEKNFQAGVEDNTNINIQIPKRNVKDVLNEIKNEDRIILRNIMGDLKKQVKIESIDEFGVPGVIRIYGTYETRTGD